MVYPRAMTNDDFRAWRKRMGWTQAECADALGLSRCTIELYERGRRREPGQKKVNIPKHIRLAAAALSLGLTDFPA